METKKCERRPVLCCMALRTSSHEAIGPEIKSKLAADRLHSPQALSGGTCHSRCSLLSFSAL